MKIENIGDLAVLVHTARSGSLTGAAAVMGVTPAAASAALKRLETQLGTRLFERSTRAMRLTEQGQTLLDYATRAFELVAEGEALVTEQRTRLVGRLRVAAPADLARTTLLAWFDEFLAQHPGVEIKLAAGDRPLDVIRDQVDVAIRYGIPADSRMVARPLLLQRPIVTASPEYLQRHGTPTTPQDLAAHNCITFGRGGSEHRQWQFMQGEQTVTVRVSGNRSVDDASLAHDWAVAGAGLLFKTPFELRADLQAGRLVQVLHDWMAEPYPLHAFLPSKRFMPHRVREFVAFLTDQFSVFADQYR
ncbi:LysR family transcriptional regulator [Amantichitinum ursilacus]|uniref:HTH-type transcriptional regulator DmlR n=1 Tax=Amantichitinum ursilacus TaxID=857265 RepID=A0A0N0GN58_9NEIS|nr:LysR family transcriptional regulator [Amantichitinum ursilacus]KPC52524.1 HTH-type transcriptional regulator DmlR [Amantichitinum ursilacus]